MVVGKDSTKKTTSKKEYEAQKTVKMQKLTRILTEQPTLSTGEAMRRAGYSKATSVAPSKITNTKGFQELMEQYLPQEGINQKHLELLNASTIQQQEFNAHITADRIKETIESIAGCELVHIQKTKNKQIAYYKQPDYKTRQQAVDMAHRIRGNYAPKKVQQENISFSLSELRKAREEEEERIAQKEAKVVHTIESEKDGS